MHIFVASSNAGKLRDFASVPSLGITLRPLPGLETIPAPEETADTFEGNARIKATAYSQHAPGLLVLADDSGLEVDALGGSPGVRSARFAEDAGFGTPGSDPDSRNNALLLEQMLKHPQERTARYRCVLALARDGEVLQTAEGTVEGWILAEPRGAGGFGYDSLFFLPERGLSFAELAPDERHLYSHRARALSNLLQQFQQET